MNGQVVVSSSSDDDDQYDGVGDQEEQFDNDALERQPSSEGAVKKRQLFKDEKLDALQKLTSENLQKVLEPYQSLMKYLIVIQAWVRMRLAAKHYQQRLKKARYRILIIKELLSTEEAYVNDLITLKEKFQTPLLKLLKEHKIDTASSSILYDLYKYLEHIRNTNQDLLIVLQIRMETLQYNSTFFKDFHSCYIDTFSTYYAYCQRFEDIMNCLQTARKKTTLLNDLIISAEKTQEFRGLDLSSMLVKPIQRLPKYILLLKDLLKHTEKQHIDYNNIEQSIKKFEEINEENNQFMNKYVHLCKLKELDNQIVQLKEKKVQIIADNREFVMDELLSVLSENFELNVVVHFFSDLVLITEKVEGEYRLWKHIEIDEFSICKNIPDQKYFSYLISLKGKNNSVTFTFSSKEAKKIMLNKIQGYLRDQRQKGQSVNQMGKRSQVIPVQVSTLGSEVRDTGNTYTLYIVEITIDLIVTRLYLRYSEVRELRSMVEKEFGIKDLPKMGQSVIGKQKTKLVEKRKVIIEDILQRILNDQDIQYKGTLVLQSLGLPIDLFQQLRQRTDEQIQSERQSLQPSYDSMRGKSSTIQILMVKQQMEGMMRSSIMRSSIMTHSVIQPTKIKLIKVIINLADQSSLELELNEVTTVGELILEIANRIQLLQTLDYKLFVMEKNNLLRSVDNEVSIVRIFQEQQKSQKIQKLNLYFRKYIFLLNKFEEQDFNEDPIRLRLIVFQVLEDIRDNKFCLKFLQQVLSACVGLYLFKPELYPIKDWRAIPFEILNQLVPVKILQQHQKHVWLINMMNCFEVLNKEMQQFIAKHKAPKQNLIDIVSFTLYVIVMQRIRMNPMYGVTLFNVEVYKQTIKDIKSAHKENFPSSIALGINVKGVGVYMLDTYQEKRFYPYNKVKEIKVFPLSIIFTFEGDPVNYRFNSHQSFHINQLLTEYQQLQELLNDQHK